MDGLTFGVRPNTSTGHFEVSNDLYIEEESPQQPPQNNFDSGIDKFDKSSLQKKFFELNS